MPTPLHVDKMLGCSKKGGALAEPPFLEQPSTWCRTKTSDVGQFRGAELSYVDRVYK
jgi:hypothetical protein